MKLRSARKNQSGYSILEVVFATSIIMTSVYAGFSGLRYLTKYNAAKRGYDMEMRYVLLVMQTIAANPSKFYVQAEYLGDRDLGGEIIKAPSLVQPYWAYSNTFFGPATECPNCPNRIGVALQAIPNSPRSAQATIIIMRDKKLVPTAAAEPASDSDPDIAKDFRKVKTYTMLVTF